MYSWYMPKDQTIDDVSPGSHRHDFENVVIWLSGDMTTVLGGAASGHGDYKITSGALPGGDSATVEYFASFPTNHQLQFTETVGNTYPVSDWDAMPDAAKSALQDTDFGDASPPFKVSDCLPTVFILCLLSATCARSLCCCCCCCGCRPVCLAVLLADMGLRNDRLLRPLSTGNGLWKGNDIQALHNPHTKHFTDIFLGR